MLNAQEIYQRLEDRRKLLGLSQAEVGSRAFGKADNSALQALRKGSLPSAEKLYLLCNAVGWEFYFGPPREIAGAEQPPAADPEEFAHIPLHEASLAAGAGAANGAEPIVDYLSFRRDWLRRIGTAPANAVLARVSGDSMEPTIWAGDMVLVDRSKTVVPVRTSSSKKGRSAIYAVLDDGHARVKRIERPSEDQILLLSDNPDYTPEFANPKTLSIIGKVMWWGHTNRD
jgi:phage repressor protein C with HTH and peptisase S24 domain